MTRAERSPDVSTLSGEDPILDDDDVLRLVDDPVLALLPWILMTLAIGPFSYLVGMSTGLAACILILGIQIVRGERPEALEWADFAVFLPAVLIGLMHDGPLQDWMNNHADEVSNVGIALVAFGSVAIGFPFTAGYTRYRLAPLSARVRRVVDRRSSMIWGWAFVAAAIAGGYGEWVMDQPNNFWTAWTLQTLPLIWAFLYVRWLDRRALATVPQYASLRRPWEILLRDCAAWTLLAGIVGQFVGHAPGHRLGWAFIAVGAAGVAWSSLRLRRR